MMMTYEKKGCKSVSPVILFTVAHTKETAYSENSKKFCLNKERENQNDKIHEHKREQQYQERSTGGDRRNG